MKFIRYLLVSMLLMLPLFASADAIIKPPGNDTWEMHVMGNGPVIASVLESVKLVIAPDGGGSGFRSMLLFIALLGFCILAVQAGFNPGANLFKMFGYLFVVWVVTLTTTQLKANILVIDPVTRTNTYVGKVPAIVGLPAAVVSGIGHYLTTTIEMAYSTPGQQMGLTTAGFDIFGKMQSDLDQYTIVQPELKQSMAAYVGDCMVPAIARHQVTASDMYTAKNLVEVLAKGTSGTTLTRYYEASPAGGTTSITFGTVSNVTTCTDAWSKLQVAIDAHAQQMLDASTAEWTKSGVMVPFESVLQSFVEQAAAGIGAGGGSYGKPTGMITQKALINTMGGDFRQAAVQSGNNELLMGLQISQAEQSQKSGWVTSAAIFKNMMGYVYTTLQAFIYAITPVVVIAIMVPGLGKKIFLNYGQVLVWLTLWEPMLSIVNYLVTLFRMEGLAAATAGSGGVTMLNTWTTSEAANNMVIAASFLGTMVPVLAWGLVTGAMAFNDFISHGIGSQFAMSAGAAAATGSVGLNSVGMNNVNSNKFDNAQKATVGNQSVMAHEGAGALMAAVDHAGRTESANGSSVTAQGSGGKVNSLTEQAATTTSVGKSVGTTEQAGSEKRAGHDTGTKSDSNKTIANDHSESSSKTASKGSSTGHDVSKSTNAKESDSTSTTEQHQVAMNLNTGAEIGAKSAKKGGGKAGAGAAGGAGGGEGTQTGAGLKAGAGVNDTQSTADSATKGRAIESGAGTSDKAGTSTSTGTAAAVNNATSVKGSVSNGVSNGTSSSSSASSGKNVSAQTSASTQKAASKTNAHSATSGLTESASKNISAEDGDRIRGNAETAGGTNFAVQEQNYATMRAASTEVASAAAALNSASHALAGAGGPAAISMPSVPGGGADLSLIQSAGTEIQTATSGLNHNMDSTTSGLKANMSTTLDSASSIMSGVQGLEHGKAGGSPFATVDGGADGKMAVMGLGAAATTVASLAANPVTQALATRGGVAAAGAAVEGGVAASGVAGGAALAGEGALATAGGITAGGLAVGTAALAGAGLAGYYGASKLDLYNKIGAENVGAFLDPVFRTVDSGIDVFQKTAPPWAGGHK